MAAGSQSSPESSDHGLSLESRVVHPATQSSSLRAAAVTPKRKSQESEDDEDDVSNQLLLDVRSSGKAKVKVKYGSSKARRIVESSSEHEEEEEKEEEEEEDVEWPVKSILKESKGEYLVDWAPDPKTGKSWPPSWEPDANITEDLLASWRAKKQTKATKSTQKTKKRSRDSAEQRNSDSEQEESKRIDRKQANAPAAKNNGKGKMRQEKDLDDYYSNDNATKTKRRKNDQRAKTLSKAVVASSDDADDAAPLASTSQLASRKTTGVPQRKKSVAFVGVSSPSLSSKSKQSPVPATHPVEPEQLSASERETSAPVVARVEKKSKAERAAEDARIRSMKFNDITAGQKRSTPPRAASILTQKPTPVLKPTRSELSTMSSESIIPDSQLQPSQSPSSSARIAPIASTLDQLMELDEEEREIEEIGTVSGVSNKTMGPVPVPHWAAFVPSSLPSQSQDPIVDFSPERNDTASLFQASAFTMFSTQASQDSQPPVINPSIRGVRSSVDAPPPFGQLNRLGISSVPNAAPTQSRRSDSHLLPVTARAPEYSRTAGPRTDVTIETTAATVGALGAVPPSDTAGENVGEIRLGDVAVGHTNDAEEDRLASSPPVPASVLAGRNRKETQASLANRTGSGGAATTSVAAAVITSTPFKVTPRASVPLPPPPARRSNDRVSNEFVVMGDKNVSMGNQRFSDPAHYAPAPPTGGDRMIAENARLRHELHQAAEQVKARDAAYLQASAKNAELSNANQAIARECARIQRKNEDAARLIEDLTAVKDEIDRLKASLKEERKRAEEIDALNVIALGKIVYFEAQNKTLADELDSARTEGTSHEQTQNGSELETAMRVKLEELEAVHAKEIESWTNKVADGKKREKRLNQDKEQAEDDMNYFKMQRGEEAEIARDAQRELGEVEKKVKELQRQLNFGVKQVQLFHEGVQQRLNEELDRARVGLALANQESTRTMAIRTKAARWDEHQAKEKSKEAKAAKARAERDSEEAYLAMRAREIADAQVIARSITTESSESFFSTSILLPQAKAVDVAIPDITIASNVALDLVMEQIGSGEESDDEDDPLVFECKWEEPTQCDSILPSRDSLYNHIIGQHLIERTPSPPLRDSQFTSSSPFK